MVVDRGLGIDLEHRHELSVTLGTSKATSFKRSSQDIPIHIKKEWTNTDI